MLRSFFLVLLLSVSNYCHGQDDIKDVNSEIDFLLYLTQNGQKNDFDYYGDYLLNKNLTLSQKDSINYLLGYVNYLGMSSTKANAYFSQVTDQSFFYPNSIFYRSLSLVEEKKFNIAYNGLHRAKLDTNNVFLHQLQIFELAGLSLLNRNFASFDSLSKLFQVDSELLNEEQSILKKNYTVLYNFKRKSPFTAGLLSAVIPGLGKAYTGNNGQALATFIRVAALGLLSVESYNKLGPLNPQFLILSSLFTIFYVGNIWGSALSVQIQKNEKFKEIDHNILVGLRVPINSFFK